MQDFIKRGGRLYRQTADGQKEMDATSDWPPDAVVWTANGTEQDFHSGFALIARLPRRFTSLNVAGPLYSDADLDVLSRLVQLEKLDIYHAAFNPEKIRRLAPLTKLKELNLPDCGITDNSLKQLEGCTELERLDLGGNGLTDAAGASLAKFKRLTYLNIGRQQITDKIMPQLQGLEQLQFLAFHSTAVTDAGLAQLAKLPLQGMEYYGSRVTLKGISQIKSLKGLNGADLGKITDNEMAIIGGMSGLEMLILNPTNITDDGLAQLEKLQDLRHAILYLSAESMEDKGLAHLAKLPKLRQLELGPNINFRIGNPVQKLPIGKISVCRSLEELTLSGITIDDAAVADLLTMNWLKKLAVSADAISAGDLEKLKKGLPGTQIIQRLPLREW